MIIRTMFVSRMPTLAFVSVLLCACSGQEGKEAGKPFDSVEELPPITDEILDEDREYMMSLYRAEYRPAGMAIDLSDPRQYRALRNRFVGYGITPETDPGLYMLLERDRKEPKRAKSISETDRCGQNGAIVKFNGTRVEAFADLSCFEQETTVLRSVRDMKVYVDGAIVAGELAELWEGAFSEDVTTLEVQADYSTLALKDTYSYANCDGYGVDLLVTGEVYYKYYACTDVTIPTDSTIDYYTLDMAHPRDFTGPPEINLCLNRYWLGEGLADCDYWLDHECSGSDCCPLDSICFYNYAVPFELAEPFNPYKLYIPMQGRSAKWTDTGGLNPYRLITAVGVTPEVVSANAWFTLDTLATESPGGGVCAPQNDNLKSECIVFEKVADTVLTSEWYMNLDKCVPLLGTRYEEGAENCSAARIDADLNIAINVRLQSPEGGDEYMAFVWRSDQMFDNLEDAVIQIVWGCLAPGTEVRMADGSTKKIEDVALGDQVVSDGRESLLTVTDLTVGREAKPLVYIEDEFGHELSLTSEHPVPLVDGKIVAAAELDIGDVILTESGTASLRRVEYRNYDGQVFNLALGTENELSRISEIETTLYANGIVVGDARMQKLLSVTRQQSAPAPSAPHVPEWMQQDYQSAMKRLKFQRNR